MVAFDTLKASRRLRDAGFEEKQANALVNAFAEDIGANLATKDDLILLRKDMASEFAAVRGGFGTVRAESDAIRQDREAPGNRGASEHEAIHQERMKAMEERMDAMTDRLCAKVDRQTTQFTLVLTGFTVLILTAIGVATTILATL